MFSNIRQPSFRRRPTSGVALVITLTMLAIVALLAIAFVMTARTELKSGSAYNDQVAAKALAKMAVDRALMEIVRQGAGNIISGGEVSNVTIGGIVFTNFINYTTNSPIYDYSCIDNYTNDIVLPLYGITPSGITNSFDFVERDGQLGRNPSVEPYWISVRDPNTHVLMGRFAYIAMGNVVDINAIGNVASTNGTYQRPADTNFGYGYLGKFWTTTTPNYTRGICADVSLEKFLQKLGYGGAGSTYTPAQAAQRILQFRYGCPANLLPSTTYSPGINGVDNNNDSFSNNATEYTVTPSLVGDDQAIGSLSQLDALPITALQPIAPDPANTNLGDYASAGPSADPNLINPYVGSRVNLNSTVTPTDVPTLANILAQFPQFTLNQRYQIAVNLIDFHTANVYPTVYYTGTNAPSLTNTIIGVKMTPYLNQIVISNMVIMTSKLISNNNTTQKSVTGRFVNVSTTVYGEIWQPYALPFPDLCQIIITNVTLRTSGADASGKNLSITNQCTISFTPPIVNGFQVSATPLYATTAFSTNSIWLSNVNVAATSVTLTQTVNTIRFIGFPSAGTTNLINQIINVPVTNIVSYPWGALLPPLPVSGSTLTNMTNYWIMNLEADDPRMNLLYTQNNVSANCNLGAMNVACYPNSTNAFVIYPDTGNREGTASFYMQSTGYSTIGDIGYVHRGEPWATIRLQPYSNNVTGVIYPYGDGKLMDYFRVNDLIDVAGRININSDTNGPLGANQSPALFALFSGITNPAYSSVGNPQQIIDYIDDNKIKAIINEVGNYRATQPNGNMVYIGQMCAITNLTTLTTDLGPVFLSPTSIPYTNDANREALIRAISNLITAWKGGGSTDIIGWGQVVKGGGAGVSNGVPGAIVAIQAKFKNVGGRIKLTSYQYISQ